MCVWPIFFSFPPKMSHVDPHTLFNSKLIHVVEGLAHNNEWEIPYGVFKRKKNYFRVTTSQHSVLRWIVLVFGCQFHLLFSKFHFLCLRNDKNLKITFEQL